MHSRILLSVLFFLLPLTVTTQESIWVSSIPGENVFQDYTVEDHSRPDLRRVGKYILPARPEARFQSLAIHNVNQYPLHFDFLIHELPDYFGGWSMDDYLQDVLEPGRLYFAGALFQFQSKTGQTVYGFDIATMPANPVTPLDVSNVYQVLEDAIALRPFAYAPMTLADQAEARKWQNPGFPIYFPEGLALPVYEAYSPATNYGRVRLFSLSELMDAMQKGELGWQDLVIADEAPTDVETVVAGIVTGTPQGELSHLNVRMLRRGTPNAYVDQALAAFQPFAGQLVRFQVNDEGYTITPDVSISEAEDWWKTHRPMLEPLPVPDDDYTDLEPLLDLAQKGEENWVTRIGGKATGLARLYSFLNPQYQVDGFAIPFSYYTEFIQNNYIHDCLDPTQFVSYEIYIQHLFLDDQFRSDSRERIQKLEALQNYMRDYGFIPPEELAAIRQTILAVFGSEDARVRFRSSSNAEDDIIFTGAGLYDSTTVCMQDELDNDDKGPSICDPGKKKERTIERGLKKVWASLWNPRAVEERAYYQIDSSAVRMGILVTRSFPDEDSNGVVFSGDLAAGTKDYIVVNVQAGDESVVQPGTGIVPEKDALYPKEDGTIEIQRLRGSSLVPAGEWILSEAQLQKLGSVVKSIDESMPLPRAGIVRDDVIMDIEFKFDEGQLFIKQIRPTVIADRLPSLPDQPVTLQIPNSTKVGNTFQDFVSIEDIYAGKSLVTFKEGNFLLPVRPGEYNLNLIEKVEFGPDRQELFPAGPGVLQVQKIEGFYTYFLYTFRQDFSLNDQTLSFELTDQKVFVNNGKLETDTLSFDPQSLLYFPLTGTLVDTTIRYASVTHESLPLFRIDVELEGGLTLQLYQRWQPIRHGSTPARLVFARIHLNEGSIEQNSFWNLDYSCKRHNTDEEFLVLFDEPLEGAWGVVVKNRYQEGVATQVYTVDQSLQPLKMYNVLSYKKEETNEPIPPIQTPVIEWTLF